jgi:hypothetical protein
MVTVNPASMLFGGGTNRRPVGVFRLCLVLSLSLFNCCWCWCLLLSVL